MEKGDFVSLYLRPRITTWFDRSVFLSDSSLIVMEGHVPLEGVGDYYCPWYYDATTQQEISAPFEQILDNPHTRAVMIRDAGSKILSKSAEIQRRTTGFRAKVETPLSPFPIATDTAHEKTLVLDGNKTLAALYQSWPRHVEVPIVEIRGANLVRVLPDFRVLYRN